MSGIEPNRSSRSRGLASRPHVWAAALSIILVATIAYGPIFGAGLILWDDDVYITDNPHMTAPDGLRRIWFTLEAEQYYPLLFTSYWIEYRIWGAHPLGYHVTNLALHVINALLVMALLRKLTASMWAAWLAAMLFAVHPMQVESVAWVAERKNVLSGMFYLISFWLYLRHREHGGWTPYVAGVLAYALALLSKTATITFPLSLILADWLLAPARRAPGTEHKRSKVPAWLTDSLSRTLPILAIGAAATILTWLRESALTQEPLPIHLRLLAACCSVWFYVYKLILPVELWPLYPKWVVSAASLRWWLPVIGLVVVGLGAWRFRKRFAAAGHRPQEHGPGLARLGVFGMGHYVLSLLPMLGLIHFIFMDYSFVANHFVYLSCIGVFLAAASVMDGLRSRWGSPVTALACILPVALGVLTYREARHWKDTESVMRRTLKGYPGFTLARVNLGAVLMAQKRIDEAVALHEETVRLMPEFAEGHNALGSAYMLAGRYQQATRELEIARRLAPGHHAIHRNLGMACAELNMPARAIEHYRLALERKPDDPDTHYNLAVSLARTGRTEEAADHYRQTIRLKPEYAKAHYNLGNTLAAMDDNAEAVAHYRRAIESSPTLVQAYYNLGVVLEFEKQYREAVDAWRAGLTHRPDDLEMIVELTWQLAASPDASVRDGLEAVRLAERAAKLSPDEVPELLDLMAAAYAQAARFDDAIAAASRAMSLAQARGQDTLAERIRARRKLYGSHKALGEPP